MMKRNPDGTFRASRRSSRNPDAQYAALPFVISGKLYPERRISLEKTVAVFFREGVLKTGEVVVPGRFKIIPVTGRFMSVSVAIADNRFVIRGEWHPYNTPSELRELLPAMLREMMRFLAKEASADAAYRGARKGALVISGTPKIVVG